MKVKLLRAKTIGGKTYPAHCVIGVSQPEAEAWIKDGSAVSVPDGTMARKAAYGVVGCMPPAGFEARFAGVETPASTTDHAGYTKQKTNTLKK